MAIIRGTGFVQLRRGLFEHVSDGSMTALGCFLYTAILANADPSTGIWEGSSGLLASLFNLPTRTCRDLIEKLEKSKYIKRFPVQGKHGSYPILVHLFECTDGAAKGKRLNATKSTSCKQPIYESCHERVNDGAATVPQSTRDIENKIIKNLSLDESQQVEKIYEVYPRKVGKAAAIKAIAKAIQRITEGELSQAPKDAIEARRFLWKKTAEFAASAQGTKPADGEDYRPHPATWFNQARYLDDVSEWQRKRQGEKLNGKSVTSDKDRLAAAEAKFAELTGNSVKPS